MASTAAVRGHSHLVGIGSCPRLNRWAWDIAKRTEHAAMSFLGFQDLTAGSALVKKLAIIGGHFQTFGVAAMRACKGALKNDVHYDAPLRWLGRHYLEN